MKEQIIKGLKWFFYSFIWVAIVVLAIDIITKRVVLNAYLSSGNNTICEIIPGFLNIEYTGNPTAAFGMGFSDALVNRILYICVASVASIILILFLILRRNKMNRITRLCLVMVVAGAVGNLIDRIFYSDAVCAAGTNYCVVDWINFYGIWPFHFNIADSSIVIAVIMLIVVLIVEEVKEYKKNKQFKTQYEEKVLSKEEQQREADKKAEESSK